MTNLSESPPLAARPIVFWAASFAFGLAVIGLFIPVELFQRALARSSGESAVLAAPLLPKLFSVLLLFFGALALVSGTIGSRIERLLWAYATRMAYPRQDSLRGSQSVTQSRIDAIVQPVSFVRESLGWAVVCVGLVLAFDWPSLLWGYFESDDFNLLIDNRTIAFPELVFAVMNDHVYPLGRIMIRGFHWLFGSNATAYNFLAVGSLAFLLWAGCMYLIEAGFTRLSTMLYAMLVVGWTMWGELTSGEYILLLHQSLMTSALLIGWSTVRWQATGHLRYCGLTSLLVAYACFMNISGFWVACAAIVFLCSETLIAPHNPDQSRSRLKQSPAILAIMLPMLLAIAVYAYAYHRPAGPDFLSSAGERNGILSIAKQCFYIIATALLSIPIAIPHHLSDFRLLGFATIASVVLFAIGVFAAWQNLKCGFLHGRLIAVLFILGGVALMISLGRPADGIGYVVPPKYLFMPYTWSCIAIAMVFDGWWYRVPQSSRPMFFKLASFAILVVWTAQGVASLLGTWGMPFFETTRGGKIREHRREYAALAEIREALFKPLDQETKGPIRIPDIPGSVLCREYPALRFPWGYEPQLGYFLDVLAAKPTRYQVLFASPLAFPAPTISRALRADVSPEFLTMVENDKFVNRLYSLPSILTPDISQKLPSTRVGQVNRDQIVDATDAQKSEEGDWLIVSNGNAKIEVDYPNWQANERHILQLEIAAPKSSENLGLSLSFRARQFPKSVMHHLMLPPENPSKLQIDLVRIPSFALSDRIELLTIHLCCPGKYRLGYLQAIETEVNSDK